MNCVRCGEQLPAAPLRRRDTCPACGVDLHSCVQCEFYAPGQYNDCREPQAERVLDKGKANFCDFFRPSDRAQRADPAETRDTVRAQLDSLFLKKP